MDDERVTKGWEKVSRGNRIPACNFRQRSRAQGSSQGAEAPVGLQEDQQRHRAGES